jgi:hypothetical protein
MVFILHYSPSFYYLHLRNVSIFLSIGYTNKINGESLPNLNIYTVYNKIM